SSAPPGDADLMTTSDLVIGIGGAAGDGVASAGNSLALALARQGQAVYAYNSYQSVIRGGHSYLRMRVSARKPLNHGDQVDALIALNQDTLDRHLQELVTGGLALYNAANVKPRDDAPEGVQLCPLPVPELTPAYKELPVVQNIVAVGAAIRLAGLDFAGIESVLQSTFARKPKIVQVNVDAAKAGYEYAAKHFQPLPGQLERTNQKWALATGNELLAMGAVFAGCKFYCAYPMSPATHILEWFAAHSRELGICVRQVEDEISVVNMTIGANHMGVRGMCATSGGGFALMTEAIGMAAIIETPLVVINVMRAGPSTGVPTKTEQADLNQALGASQGDFPRIILAPLSMPDCFNTAALAFNLADRYQCPVIILSDVLMGEGNETVDPALLDVEFSIDRGELITAPPTPALADESEWGTDGGNLTAGLPAPPLDQEGIHGLNGEPYLRYRNTASGISPRAIPGVPGHMYVSGSDEHDEDGVLLSDVYTDTTRRKKMVDKRARKFSDVFDHLPVPKLAGPDEAEVTLVGWGSTWGVIHEAVERLNHDGISANYVQFQVLFPFPARAAQEILEKSRRIIVVENNHSGQFARHLRAETGIAANGHIRKYDGEPFEPKHVIAGVNEILNGKEVVEVLSTEPGWQTEHPSGTTGDWAGSHARGSTGSRSHVH
ncbi:MAG TPA: 2-oxoacid:acceptor oxidoreductase subunit alpha, partial [Candidatus Limnocylindria bacterium]|nr:2-oxoacid:acceptor oxidoreductase subunit alpha [Candidatus Limnocylindria bacterium]